MAGINLLDKLKKSGRGVEIKESSGGSRFKFSVGSGPELTPENTRSLVLFVLGLAILFGSNYWVTDYTERLTAEKQAEASSWDKKIADEKKRSVQLREVKEEADRYQARIDDLTAKLKKVEMLSQNRNYLVRAVDFVVQEMPSNIWIRDVKVNLVDDQTLSLSGNATTMQIVGDFMQRLQPGSFFNSWNLVETRLEDVSNKTDPISTRMPVDAKSFEISAKVVVP